MSKAKKQKEAGLRPLEAGVGVSCKPRFVLRPFSDPRHGHQINMPYPVIRDDRSYADYVQSCLAGLKTELTRRVPEAALSFLFDPVTFARYATLVERDDIFSRQGSLDDTLLPNEIFGIEQQRRYWLNQTMTGHHDCIGVASTRSNTRREEGKTIIEAPLIRPICNTVVSLGARFGRTHYQEEHQQHYEFHWEVFYPTPSFLGYLGEVHSVITGADHSGLGQIPLEIAPRGSSAIGEEDLTTINDLLEELARTYSHLRVPAKFMHATGRETKEGLKIRHLDGSLMDYDFDTLRRRLYDGRGSEGRVDESGYRKVFKIDVNRSLDDGFVLPIYSSLDDPNAFDMHDIVDVFMARCML